MVLRIQHTVTLGSSKKARTYVSTRETPQCQLRWYQCTPAGYRLVTDYKTIKALTNKCG